MGSNRLSDQTKCKFSSISLILKLVLDIGADGHPGCEILRGAKFLPEVLKTLGPTLSYMLSHKNKGKLICFNFFNDTSSPDKGWADQVVARGANRPNMWHQGTPNSFLLGVFKTQGPYPTCLSHKSMGKNSLICSVCTS